MGKGGPVIVISMIGVATALALLASKDRVLAALLGVGIVVIALLGIAARGSVTIR